MYLCKYLSYEYVRKCVRKLRMRIFQQNNFGYHSGYH
eukprot:UN06382